MRLLGILSLTILLSACGGGDETEGKLPDPIVMTEDAVSFYCQMNVLEHPGPKAQIHIEGLPAPLFFAQVRDAVAFLKGEERPGDVVVTYVSDMAKADNWDEPGIENWISADKAMFVVGSKQTGGMGAPEVVPFGSEASALIFAQKNGGKVMPLSEIPAEAVLSSVTLF
ncbi:NosL [Pseudovibrio axinellae]|uniref:NosL n=1 Tax=Pseudovibrio axinellae TaxID=989403 RepID=A0A165T187_9HYPH|nr:nitrous oxide reductase accessory protein NosL [Pseudovibrio axinellae]KZL05158.1 NosL [Pseudovibrio axinellae]SER50447.1 copper chaperone NosL [Pseudovibrio axinellae]